MLTVIKKDLFTSRHGCSDEQADVAELIGVERDHAEWLCARVRDSVRQLVPSKQMLPMLIGVELAAARRTRCMQVLV
jgi:hypothetical protein